MAKILSICRRLKNLKRNIPLLGTQSCVSKNMSTLAYEEIVVPEEKQKQDISSLKRAVILHGLMGSGRNWKSFSKNLAKSVIQHSPSASSGWCMTLVDLRHHGHSAGREGFKPPHDMSSAALDIANLVKSENWVSPDVVIGHSMGGKVALEYAKCCARRNYGDYVTLPKQLWVLDSVPGEVPTDNNEGEVEKVLDTLKHISLPIASRRWFVEHMINQGFSKTLTDWLSSSLKKVYPSQEEVTWIFDLDAIIEMFDSYRKTNYWSFLQNVPHGLEISIVRAENSDRWTPTVLSQLETCINNEQNTHSGKLSCHFLKNAGHWLHIDNPKGLIDLMAPSLARL